MSKACFTQSAADCPVLPLALRVGELWDAHATAQEREREDPINTEETADQIQDLRIAVEETASFARARSLGGALFQIALAQDTVNTVEELIPRENKMGTKECRRLTRLLESVALALRDQLGPDYQAVREVVSTYMNIDEGNPGRALRWLEDIKRETP
jgi:hypothetical protein